MLAMADGSLPSQPSGALAHILLAAADEAALYIVNADDPLAAHEQSVTALDNLLRGLSGAP